MVKEADTTTSTPDDVLTESARQYYLDVMGVQCWQLRDKVEPEAVEVKAVELEKVESVADEPETVVLGKQKELSKNAASEITTWSLLETSIQQCENCQLCKTRKQAIVGRGNQMADLMFVLLAPEKSDDDANLICSGEANVLLSKMLSAINISIDDVYITSLLKCSVPPTHTISPKEILSCDNYLQQQVRLVKPKIIVVLGETTIRCLLQKNLSLDDYRAMNDQSQHQIENVPIFVSYSPKELAQQTENKRKAWLDLQLLQKMIGM